jgi:hypothetical protein
MLAQRALMVQQKMPIEQGEWSLVFLGGEFSHAVLKRPAVGDFRVQEEHGGSTVLADAPAWMVTQAERVLAAATSSASTSSATGASTSSAALYARVDGVVVNGRFVLMELELIEPALFLGLAAGSVERFAAQIAARLREK